ncbi:DNA replication ATP-dependent helicase/nuclease DNA2 [Anopheles maculipalpis]|uniref:DNA replication ATP-dependent helicase/nuclease DNA2 n=1 Tax=Anopheles maculipalpis TaxID=1496333 RepID=UPI002158B601|nr:DNA replication ATP-dependent helicase/nuclease DNA2 [Anopheles maculipalpis]
MKRRISSPLKPPNKILELAPNNVRCFVANKAICAESVQNELKDSIPNDDLSMDWDEEWFPDVEFDSKTEKMGSTLDLSAWKRCKVLEAQQVGNQFIKVTLEGKRCKQRAVCHLLPPWNSIEGIVAGLTVSVLAIKENSLSDHFVVNSERGFFVTNPDLLVSGTTVVGSLFCQRRGVLQELFRMSEAENEQMVIGTLAHCIFQRCLVDKSCKTLKDVETVAKDVLKSRKIISTLYAMKLTVPEAFRLVEPYLKQIESFLHQHLQSNAACKFEKLENGSGPTKILISEVNDIEENIWCHQLGIKGRIDATVSVVRDQAGKSYETMPLELKTGRASNSFEHLGQLALYEMMMELVGHKVSAGLLLYLRDGKCNRIVSNRNMKRDLIMLRNEVARYLSIWMIPNVMDKTTNCEESLLPMQPTLPAPINNERACPKCPYSTVCVALAKREHEFPTYSTNQGFSSVADEACGHLKNSDLDYFVRWTGLIYLEVQDSTQSHLERDIWSLTPQERYVNGWCITGLTLLSPVHAVDEAYYHTFTLAQPTLNSDAEKFVDERDRVSQLVEIFQLGEYVICSTTKRIAVAAGHVISLVGNELVVAFERDLSVNYSGEQFILDQHVTSSGRSSGFEFVNLAMLLSNDDTVARYRRIIIDRERPTFSDGFLCKSMIPKAKEILKNLNRHQKQAALKAAATDSYCLLKGLPGTGKTQTIVGLIRLLSLLGQSILLTSNTHSAVDNILKRLLPFKELSFIRIGTLDRIDPAIREYAEPILAENADSPEKLAELYGKFQIIAVTCKGTGHAMIAQRTFDYCIVDEATQVFQASIIRPLLRCKKFLLVGDPEQLPPVVKSAKARSLGATESLFHRLDQEESFCVLPTQYRMNRILTKLANDFTYDGKLVCGNDVIANATLKLPNLQTVRRIYEVERWLMKTISNQIDLSAVVVDTGNTHQLNLSYRQLNEPADDRRDHATKSHMKCANIFEVALVVYICQALLRAGVSEASIGIIAPFRAQVDLIRTKILKLSDSHKSVAEMVHSPSHDDNIASDKQTLIHGSCAIEVNTVDQYQGKDKKIIIFSCTKSFSHPPASDKDCAAAAARAEGEILNDKRRLTVAITRAQEKFIVVGDMATLNSSYSTFQKLFSVMNKVSSVPIVDKKEGFEWANVMELLASLSE